MHLAVVLGAAVTSAVLTGALIVGDSVRGSLYDLTIERLGKIDYAFLAEHFLAEQTAQKVASDSAAAKTFGPVVPIILLQGAATNADSGRRASKVSIQGIDADFLQLFEPSPEAFALPFDGSTEETYPSVVINRALQEELEVAVGDSILLSFVKQTAVNPEFLLGSRESTDLYGTLRVTLSQVVSDSSLGRFSLELHQDIPRNVFIARAALQRAIGQQGRVNALMMASGEVTSEDLEQTFRNSLAKSLSLRDLGLILRQADDEVILESEKMIISPSLEEEIFRSANEEGLAPQPILTYLANAISSENGTIPYSTVTALDPAGRGIQHQLRLLSGASISGFDGDAILLNQWAAEQLNAQLGDRIELTYFVVDWNEAFETRSESFRLSGIVSMEGLAVDDSLTPRIRGVHDSENMSAWNPPVPIDLDQIRPEDENYWDEYRTAPKVFLPYRTGVSLWQSRFGKVTSIRLRQNERSLDEVESALLGSLNPSLIGHFWPVKEQGLQAAAGATDFGMLFIGFSFFLIVSAVLLVALLFRLGVEYRIREVGTLLSLGFPFRNVKRKFLSEGIVLAGIGSILGLIGAVGYAWLMIIGLQTLWVRAIGSSFLSLHLESTSLIIGLLISLIVIVVSISLTFRSLSRLSKTEMLAGVTVKPAKSGAGVARWCFFICTGLAVVLFIIAVFSSAESSPVLFFAIGSSVLVAGISLFSVWLKRGGASRMPTGGRLFPAFFAFRNTARNPGRSLLSAILVGSACFVIVTVAANRSSPGDEVYEKTSGAGGFSLKAESDIPIVRDLNNGEALFDLGFSDPDAEVLASSRVFGYRLLPGEDVSCRNLYQPGRPRILGVPEAQIERGGFRFQSLIHESDQPWSLLKEELGPGVIPAFGDMNSVMWILHKSLGDELTLIDGNGEEVRLRLVGLLSRSIFQSELLISGANFEKHFPVQSGFSYFLIDAPPQVAGEISGVLEDNLSRWGFDATSTKNVLAGFLAIENTYLSTFQTLGGLGLLLGTLGLAIVVIRNTIERRGELATLQAFGFPRKKISGLVLTENCYLLLLGIILGTVSALLAVMPHLLQNSEGVHWGSLLLTLVAVFVVGALASGISVSGVLKKPLIPTLRGE